MEAINLKEFKKNGILKKNFQKIAEEW